MGRTPMQPGLLSSTVSFCEGRLAPNSIYAVLHRECRTLFPDEMFADLFAEDGRRSVPPMIVAVVMVLQRLEGLSDREAVDRFAFDVRWKYAAGGLDFDHPGFVHTVLVDMRARLAASDRPNRIFERTVQVAAQAGLVGRRRVLDSTPIYDAVATQDTITLIRSAVRGLLRASDHRLRGELRAVISSGDAYTDTAKPVIDWTDAAEREALVDSRARDGYALLAVLDGRTLEQDVAQAARLLATVLGQDLERDGEGGVLRIARKVAKDRVISTVDPEARHGHKTVSRSFDGYKGHIAEDPDSEIITATVVTAGNVGDADPAAELLAGILPEQAETASSETASSETASSETASSETASSEIGRAEVYGDAAYGTGPLLAKLAEGDVISMVKVQPAGAPGGRFTKDVFSIDLAGGRVTCPNQVTVEIRPQGDGGGVARFGAACAACPLAVRCTTAKDGRDIKISPYEQHLAAGRARSADPDWLAGYRATRPKVERKLAHMLRRRHGGRRARVRGRAKIDADFSLLAAAVNLARLGVLGVASTVHGSWMVATV
ncbi:IS1182 family transposase [Microbispora sp. NBC_01389]|uniref:IS1182 family transposase n=1 Tax=Microbispora sp. NBC_01389 TaxID=2903584 RepID=UPI003249AE59